MNQVHKESLTSVENALPNRQGLEVEIFGIEGIPEDVVQQHNQRIIQNFYQDQADRYAATGNPPPGQNTNGPTKKIKIETADELKKRLADHRAKVAAQKSNGGVVNQTPPMGLPDGHSPGQNVCVYCMVLQCDQYANVPSNRIHPFLLPAASTLVSLLREHPASLLRPNTPKVVSTTLPRIFRRGPEAICLRHPGYLRVQDNQASRDIHQMLRRRTNTWQVVNNRAMTLIS
jgi:hypothetical protein